MTIRHALLFILLALFVPAPIFGADKDYTAELPRVPPK
jgi:hypothetical protein